MDKISKSQVKMVRSLQQKKFRDELGMFVAEGEKCVSELLKSFDPELIIVSAEKGISPIPNPSSPLQGGSEGGLVIASPTEIEQMSSLRTPQGVIGVFKKRPDQFTMHNSPLILALDGIQDPGNLGTIIRTCDWFGVHDIVCSPDTADCYNPKVVQATMGALARVRVHYVNLPAWLQSQMSNPSSPSLGGIEEGLRIFGTLLEGKNMYEVLANLSSLSSLSSPSLGGIEGGFSSIIVMGNEGNGISPAVRSLVTHPIRIPSFPENAETSESLNVSIATAIVLAEFRRMETL